MNTVKSRVRAYFARYGIGTFELIHAFAAGGKSAKATEAALAELRAEGRLRSVPFCGNKCLYIPTVTLARELGIGERSFARPPGVHKITECLTIAMFCQRNNVNVLTRAEFARTCPDLRRLKKFSRSRYFIEPGEIPRLVVLVPDFRSRWENVAKKARRAIQARKQFEQFRNYIFNDMFRVALVTAVEQKAEILREELASEAPLISVYVVPEVFQILRIK